MYESAFHFTPKEGDIFLYVFVVTDLEGNVIDKSLCEGVLKEALEQVMTKELENGYLNALITKAGMNYRQINLLRLYYNYYFQIERIFTRKTVARVMISHAEIIKLLFSFFDYKFNPKFSKSERDSELPIIRENILNKLKEVADINEDRILKAICLFICYGRNPFKRRQNCQRWAKVE
jgi:glutamate dehydrogenase